MTISAPFETVVVRRRYAGTALVDGKTRTSLPEYGIWQGIMARCLNETSRSFSRYGGRGIKVCDRWRVDFANFYEDMGPRPSRKHSIDRIDNDGNYEPSNCRWATPREQVLNRSTPQNVWTDKDFETLRRMYAGYYSVAEIATALNRTVATVRLRLHYEKLRRDGFLTRLAAQNPELRHLLHEGNSAAFLQAVTAKKELRVRKAEAQRRANISHLADQAATIMRRSVSRNAKMRMMREAGMSLSEVGRRFSVTRERVRQIEASGFPEDEGFASGDRRKISKTNPDICRKKIDRLCRAWNAASSEARVAFVAAAPHYLFNAISTDLVEAHNRPAPAQEPAA